MQVYAGAEQQLQKPTALWTDVESACSLCWTAERELTLENFEKACKAVIRLQESAAVGELEQALALDAVPGMIMIIHTSRYSQLK